MHQPRSPRLGRWLSFALIIASTLSSSAAIAGGHRETPIVLAVRKAAPAVVNISSEKDVLNATRWDRDLPERQRVNGMGSGVIVDQRGYIVTNAHVVDRVTTLKVKLHDGSTFDAKVVGVPDRKSDLALLQIDAGRPLPTIPIGTSSDLMIGEPVIAIGNAYGYENSTSTGIISAIGRTVRLNEEMTYYDLIQTDASINPGNSGGALINIDGELIGINVAIRAGANGISFAVPVNTVRRVAADLLSIRRINGTWHGLQLDETASPRTSQTDVVVHKVEGPGEKSGFRTGDQVVQVGDMRIQTSLDFERSLLALRNGDRTPVVVRRGPREETLELTVEDLPSGAETPTETVWRQLGVTLSKLEAAQVKVHDKDLLGGMLVVQVQPGSPAAAAGVQSGDMLIGLQNSGQDNFAMLKYEDVIYVLTQAHPESRTPLAATVLRSGKRQRLELLPATATKTSASSRR